MNTKRKIFLSTWAALLATQSARAGVEFLLVDADTLQVHQNLSIDPVVVRNSLPTNVTIEARVDPVHNPKSARIILGSTTRNENVQPYYLFGDSSGDPAPGPMPTGVTSLSATAYSKSGQLGTVVAQASIDVNFIEYASCGSIPHGGFQYSETEFYKSKVTPPDTCEAQRVQIAICHDGVLTPTPPPPVVTYPTCQVVQP